MLQNGNDETGSILSSTFSLGVPADTASEVSRDPEAEEEFSKVVDGIKQASLEEKEPLSRRPTRPHHSSGEEREDHPLSTTTSATNTPSISRDESMSEESDSGFPLSRCFFCNYNSPSWKLNALHMSRHHGMFVPEQNYLVDLEGLMGFLREKITEDHECLYCHKLKGSTAAVQTHMRDKGHCMIAFEAEEDMIEVGQFYDFSSTYSDEEEGSDTDMEDAPKSNGVRLGANPALKQRTVIEDEDGDHEMDDDEGENGEGWETDSDESSLDSDELTAVPIDDHSHLYEKLSKHRHHSHNEPRSHRSADGYHSHAHARHAVFHSDHELHLPSGRVAGHRSLAKYYRQNLHNYPTPAERAERLALKEEAEIDEDEADKKSSRAVTTVPRGERGLIGVSDVKKREVQAAAKRDRRREQRAQNSYKAGVEKQNNYQKHFRVCSVLIHRCILQANIFLRIHFSSDLYVFGFLLLTNWDLGG